MAKVIEEIRSVGTSHLDADSDIRFEINRPVDRQDLWSSYLTGASASYSRYGVQGALDLPSIRSGTTTAMFVVGVDLQGNVVCGMRVVGPLRSSDEAHVTEEFLGSSVVREIIDEAVPYGVIEIKGCWVDSTVANRSAVSDALARCYVHAMDVLDVQFACCSAAGHAVRRWQGAGGRLVTELAAVPYPDHRYQTVMLWWDRSTVHRLADPEQLRRIRREREQRRMWPREDDSQLEVAPRAALAA
jgi:hypothetical protein